MKIKEFYPRHKANLDDDWQNFELMLKREKQMRNWKNGSKKNKRIPIFISMKVLKIPNSGTTDGLNKQKQGLKVVLKANDHGRFGKKDRSVED